MLSLKLYLNVFFHSWYYFDHVVPMIVVGLAVVSVSVVVLMLLFAICSYANLLMMITIGGFGVV